MTQTELARLVGISKSGVSRLETAESLPKDIDIAVMLRILGVVGAEFDQIMALAREVRQPNFLATLAPRLPQQLRVLIDYQRTAKVITSVNLTAFPGLLQAPEYSHAILATPDRAPDELKRLLRVRRERQAVLDGPVQLVAYVDEPVLQSVVGGPKVTISQLRYVLDMAQRPNVDVRVIPFGDAEARTELARYNSGYLLFEFAKPRPVAYVELPPLGGMFFDQRPVVDNLISTRTKLHELAFSKARSALLIEKSIETLESQ